MSLAVCAIGMALLMTCIFGMGVIGKLRSRVRRGSEGPGS